MSLSSWARSGSLVTVTPSIPALHAIARHAVYDQLAHLQNTLSLLATIPGRHAKRVRRLAREWYDATTALQRWLDSLLPNPRPKLQVICLPVSRPLKRLCASQGIPPMRHDPATGTSSSSFLNQEVIENVGRLAAAMANISRPAPKAGIDKPSRLYTAAHAPPRVSAVLNAAAASPAKVSIAHGPVPAPSRMATTVVGGQRFAAPAGRKERAVSARKAAMLNLAHQRAVSMAPAHASDQQRADLVDAVRATHELAEFGAAYTTLDKDDHAWEYWERFCQLYGWETSFTAEYAHTHPNEICERLAIFQAWVYPQLRGRGERSDAKPRTVFNNYVLAILRILGREHVPVPKAKSVEKSLAGLMRSFKEVYGVEHLMPGRKQPITPSMFATIERLADGTRLR